MPRSTISRDAKQEYNRRAYLQRRKKQEQQGTERRVPWTARIRETLMGRVNRLVQESYATGRFSYRSTVEAFEDLVIRGLQTLKGDITVDEMVPFVELMQQIDRLHRIRREAQASLNRSIEEINELIAIGSVDGAVRYYHVTLDAIAKMPPTEWRDWALKRLREQFPELDRREIKGVSLAPEAAQPEITRRRPKVATFRQRRRVE